MGGLAQPNFRSYSSGWRRGPLNVPTLNFAKCAKFRMGHPFSMIDRGAQAYSAKLLLRVPRSSFAWAGFSRTLGDWRNLTPRSTLRGGGVAHLRSPP